MMEKRFRGILESRKRGWNIMKGHSSTDCCHGDWVFIILLIILKMSVVTSVVGQHVVIITTAISLFLTIGVIFERRVGPSTNQ